MRTAFPVFPVALGTVSRGVSAAGLGLAALLAKLARARANRRQARALAGLDRHMLADLGINHSDLRDAFSSPVWEDPTELLQARAAERRTNRSHAAASIVPATGGERPVENGFRRPSLARPVRAMI